VAASSTCGGEGLGRNQVPGSISLVLINSIMVYKLIDIDIDIDI